MQTNNQNQGTFHFHRHSIIPVWLVWSLVWYFGCQPSSSTDSKASTLPEATETASIDQLRGTWKLLAAKWNADTKQFADNTIYKIYTRGRFALLFTILPTIFWPAAEPIQRTPISLQSAWNIFPSTPQPLEVRKPIITRSGTAFSTSRAPEYG